MSVIHGEGGPPPQLEGPQHREEAARQQQELDKEKEGPSAERRPASLLRTGFQLRQAIKVLQIEDHKIETLLKKNLHRQEGHDRPRQTPSKTRYQIEGSGMSPRAENKSRRALGPLRVPPFRAFDPFSPKWGEEK